MKYSVFFISFTFISITAMESNTKKRKWDEKPETEQPLTEQCTEDQSAHLTGRLQTVEQELGRFINFSEQRMAHLEDYTFDQVTHSTRFIFKEIDPEIETLNQSKNYAAWAISQLFKDLDHERSQREILENQLTLMQQQITQLTKLYQSQVKQESKRPKK